MFCYGGFFINVEIATTGKFSCFVECKFALGEIAYIYHSHRVAVSYVGNPLSPGSLQI